MIHFDWLWKGIFFWFCVVYHFQFASVDGHHYSCTTLSGHNGLCVARRFCREAVNQFLKPCEGDDHVCCPIQPSHRSAQRPVETTTKAPIRPERPRQSPSYDRNPPRTSYEDQRPERPRQNPAYDRNPPRTPYEDQRPERPIPSYGQPTAKPTRPSRTREPVAQPVTESKVQPEPEYEYFEARPTKVVVHNRPPDRRPTDVSEVNENRPDPRRQNPSENRSSGPGPNRPSHPSSNDGIEPQLDPPRRQKPPMSSPPRELPQPLPQVPACGVKPYDLFIAGGEFSEEHEWPWMAAIFQRHVGSRPKKFQCGGSLINTRYVLTAAHCFVNNNVILPASSYVVRLGSHALSSGDEYAVSNLVLHYNHSGMEYFNDIALVRLSSEVYITDKIAPICLPSKEMLNENFVGRMGVVAGWGDTFFRSETSRVLKHVSVPVVSNEECAAAYRRVRGAVFLARGSNHVMCAGLMEGGKDACQGDSGGPLMMKSQSDHWAVVGIVSLGYKCAEPGYPGVYTRVTHYIPWINANMKPY